MSLSTLAVAEAIVPIGVSLISGPGTISLVVAEAPDTWTGRPLVSLVIGAMALGLRRRSCAAYCGSFPAPHR